VGKGSTYIIHQSKSQFLVKGIQSAEACRQYRIERAAGILKGHTHLFAAHSNIKVHKWIVLVGLVTYYIKHKHLASDVHRHYLGSIQTALFKEAVHQPNGIRYRPKEILPAITGCTLRYN
jgi:hypothetical protein